MLCCLMGNLSSLLNFLVSPLGLVCLTVLSLYFYLTWNFKKWENMGVPFIPPTIVFGNVKERLLFRLSFPEIHEQLYFRLEGHPIGGIYEGRRTMLLIRDPDIIRNIMVRDFECFVDRVTLNMRPKSIGESMLLFLKGSEWKDVRSVSTPIFSSGKMKSMSHLIIKCTEQMTKYLDKYHEDKDIEMKEFFGRFTLDTIASCAFGIQCDSLENPDAEFVRVISKFNELTFWKRIALFVSIVILGSPKVGRLLGVRFMNLETQNYLAKVVLESKAHREREAAIARENGEPAPRRVDFLQLMLDTQAGRLKDHKEDTKEELFEKEAKLKSTTKPASSALTDEVVIGQSLLFLLAGFETSSTLLTFACYELALNTEIQDRVRTEVQTVLATHDGRCSYEALAEMPYLENVLQETLRKHPPVSRVERECTVDHYHVTGTNAHLKRRDVVAIPVRGLHYDPKYYPEPNKFDPDRFLPENKQKRSPYVFLPFGSGPRNCIGMRFAMLSSKMAMASLLNVYKFEPCERTQIPFIISKKSVFLKAEDGIYLKVKKI